MKLQNKAVVRNFSLRVDLPPPFDSLASEVVDLIETDEVLVVDPADEGAFILQPGEFLEEKATFPIRITEWLPVACQTIRLQDEGDGPMTDGALAHYASNANKVVFGIGSLTQPPGPAAHSGEIVICRQVYTGESEVRFHESYDAFRFVIAHELVHAFDNLRVLVSACLDWETMWHTALRGGIANEEAAQQYAWRALTLDQYDSKEELESIRLYWPSRVENWFKAFRGNLPGV